MKQHHPDANGGDRSTEDRLIEIIKAYNYLKTVVRALAPQRPGRSAAVARSRSGLPVSIAPPPWRRRIAQIASAMISAPPITASIQ